ncbi:MAG: hypothetical protein ABI939_12570 [Anaerolineaceae bacterium]
MTSELLTYAILAERERVYDGLRWLREWRRGSATSQSEAVWEPPVAAPRRPELTHRCLSTETCTAAGR